MTNAVSPSPLFNWLEQRAAGLLLHPTSLAGNQGIGVLDQSVDQLLRFLKEAGIRYWQVCPLGPTGYGDSPYQCFSSFAGNPYLIDLVALQRMGLLEDADLAPLRALPEAGVDFGALYGAKWPALFTAHANFKELAPELPYGDFAAFTRKNKLWLEPYALFMALKDHYQGQPWWLWDASVRFYRQATKSPLVKTIAERAEAYAFFQFVFHAQWQAVREKAAALDIAIIGDVPIFVARDSADVWANPELFQLDQKSGVPLRVAGVPPDYFSKEGQLWGNPLYDWARHASDGYAWWLQRLRANFILCDVVRIDHFRGFDTYWSIPADAATAKTGVWEKGPGLEFFEAVKHALPDCRLIAEDLGELSPSVHVLRKATGLPGMAILQFAFGGDNANTYLPHHLTANNIVYPGTHDNDTTLGWYAATDEKTRDHVRRYLRVDGSEINWDFVRAGYAAVSNLAVFPLQDLLGLGSPARFNTPGVAAGNWQWRYSADQLEQLHRHSANYLRELAELYTRI
ncbi:MAG: 4-alpha-glucanotransferase [Cephaloticoccus sp.]|nr:4-alpha-glucanotransferase [Cephaloticoccus sp.]MCF7760791.1 4-alpha-glucanotransferase [Cephaloticoccus sp.]